MGSINNIPALVQTVAWRRSGAKLLTEPMMVRLPTNKCIARPQRVKPTSVLSCLKEYFHAWSVLYLLAVYPFQYLTQGHAQLDLGFYARIGSNFYIVA